MKYLQYILSALVLSVVVVVATVTPTHAIDSYGVGAVPAYPSKDNPRAQSIFIYQLEPGKTVNDGIRVVNNTDMTKTIAVYPVDSEPSSDGAFACKQQVEPRKSVGGWLKLAKEEVTLEGHSEEIIPFTLTVPSNADVGEQNGCIAIQDERKNEATGNGIVLSFRSALRVAVMVPGEIKAGLTVKEFNVSTKADKILATPLLKNSGNVSIDSRLDVNIKDVLGRTIEMSSGKFPILRDTASRFNVEFNTPFWGGWYNVGGSVTYSALQTTSEENEIYTPVQLPTRTLFVMPEPKALAIEAGIAAALLALIGFGIWRVIYSRRMNRKAFAYEVIEGDDIQSLAEKNDTKWKTIAQLNNLKPPYSLQPGTKIKIPGKRVKGKTKSNRPKRT